MKDDRLYLVHMAECIANIEEDTRGERNAFVNNRTIRDAVLRNLQLLAESSKRVSKETQAQHPEIPWRDLADFRNVVVHEYLRVDLDQVWRIIEEHLPSLKAQLAPLLGDLRPQT